MEAHLVTLDLSGGHVSKDDKEKVSAKEKLTCESVKIEKCGL